MSEILLQTIVEKLESLEIAVLKPPITNKEEALQQSLLKEVECFQAEITKLPGRFSENEEKLNKLLESVNALNSKLIEPIQGTKSIAQMVEKGNMEIKRLIEISLKKIQSDNMKVFLESDAKKWIVVLLIALVLLTYLYNFGSHWLESHK
ncbi:MAG: hypothetical protein ABI863_03725 [Ginsengibacter sp.]